MGEPIPAPAPRGAAPLDVKGLYRPQDNVDGWRTGTALAYHIAVNDRRAAADLLAGLTRHETHAALVALAVHLLGFGRSMAQAQTGADEHRADAVVERILAARLHDLALHGCLRG